MTTPKPPRPAILALPPTALRAAGRVRAFGRVKYPADDWRRIAPSEHMEAAAGHMLDAANGLTADHESGEHPLAHAIVRLMMALERAVEQPQAPQCDLCSGLLACCTGARPPGVCETCTLLARLRPPGSGKPNPGALT